MSVTERVQKYKANDIDHSTSYVFELVRLHRGEHLEDFIQFQLDWFAAPQASRQEPGAA